jgi:hypothetical protein
MARKIRVEITDASHHVLNRVSYRQETQKGLASQQLAGRKVEYGHSQLCAMTWGTGTCSATIRTAGFQRRISMPWRGMKRDVWEGGHREAFLAAWPSVIPAGSDCDQLVGLGDFMDWHEWR